MLQARLNLTLAADTGTHPLDLTLDRLIVAGWVGKDKEALQAHIEELRRLGVPAPLRTPTYMNLSPALVSTAPAMDVIASESSGEVECVLFKNGTKIYLGIGSDHTDRDFEKYGIPASKQMCAKPVADTVWDLDDVRSHLDQLVLRSWMTIDGERRLYQEGCLGDNLNVLSILAGIPEDDGLGTDCFCLFCGTFAAMGGIAYGEFFEFEIEDLVLNRKISHGYQIQVLPQYL
jgi:hypothetical protein